MCTADFLYHQGGNFTRISTIFITMNILQPQIYRWTLKLCKYPSKKQMVDKFTNNLTFLFKLLLSNLTNSTPSSSVRFIFQFPTIKGFLPLASSYNPSITSEMNLEFSYQNTFDTSLKPFEQFRSHIPQNPDKNNIPRLFLVGNDSILLD